MTTRQIVELFHLVLVRALFANLKDKRLLALKGGLNLRFYFQSVRFSEIYSSRETWEAMQLDVIERLEALQ